LKTWDELDEDEKIVARLLPASATIPKTQREKHRFCPRCWFETDREFEKSPWDIIGIYHSHPDHPSRASQTDTDEALGAGMLGYSFVIGSVQKGNVAGAQSWVLNEAEKRFYEEPLVVDEGDRK
jgi:proteasome lid subunit RPN8/RPN11